MVFYDPADEVQSNSSTLSNFLGSKERFKNSGNDVVRDTWSVIYD